tara:strand:- start:39 stop:1058 length:1020 start_codon:yes stop_codon:yes gene_type:complete
MIEESLNNAIKRIQKKKKMQEASGLAARMSAAYTKNKDLIKAKKGLKKPKKGGALATTKGSNIKKTGSSALTPVKDARAGITKPEPEAKDQTIDVKSTEVGGDLAKKKSNVGSMANSGKKTVDPKKNTVTSGAQQGAKRPGLPKDSKDRDLKRDIDQNSDEKRRKKAEDAEEKAKEKRSKLAKRVKNTAKSAIGGAAAAYGKSSFSVRESKTFAQFVDDAVVLDETLMPGDDPSNKLGKAITGLVVGGAKSIKNRIVTPVFNMIKGTQKNLFPKGTPERPFSKNPRAVGAKAKRDYKKNQTEKLNNKKTSDEAQQKAIEKWRKDNNLEGTNIMPPWAGK